MSSTGLFTHPAFLAHDTGRGHPERPERLASVLRHLEATGLTAELEQRTPGPVAEAVLLRVHPQAHLRRVEAGCRRGGALDAGDTVVSPASWDAALRAAGGAVEAVDAVMAGDLARAFVACRPPGHHAERDRPMGFCLINNIAVAARHLRVRHGLARVAIVDFDVHHGNGTQHLFEDDPTVLYVSLHQWPWYPGTGAASERGVGDGEGATLNCPMASGANDDDYARAFERQVMPALEDFAPEFLLISAGFDAHVADPLSATRVTEAGFGRMTEDLVDLARGTAGGRVVSLLEGGYDLDALARSVAVHVAFLRA